MAKKPKKAAPPKATKPPARSAPASPPPAASTPSTTATTPPAATNAAAPRPKSPRPASARFRRSQLSPAGRRGAELVRFLRIHSKHPYAKRGEAAIHKLAVETAHLGRLELDAVATIGPEDKKN
jgi:hypothetical protein